MGELARKLKALREGQRLSQDALAAKARRFGLSWSRSTVAKLETGERELTAEEFLVLAFLLELPLTSFAEGADTAWVPLSSHAKLQRQGLRRLLEGDHPINIWMDQELRLPKAPKLKAAKTVKAWAWYGESGDAEHKAARKLGLEPRQVEALAGHRWKLTMTAERERRLSKRPEWSEELSPRTRQAMRGRLTRILIEELRDEMRKLGWREKQ